MRRLNVSAIIAASLIGSLAPSHHASSQSERSVSGGNPSHGAALVEQLGCGGCHTIPGIRGARGLVGPPLDNIADRMIIAGVLANTADNMVAWLRAPQSVVAGNAMPNMGLDGKDARDVAAYLYTLR